MHHLKRYIYILLPLLAICSLKTEAQSNKGFVQDEVIKVQNIATDSAVYGLNTVQKKTTVAYYDGWGRTTQTVARQASPAGNDMVQPIVYDKLGRQTISYQPYTATSTSGGYQATAITDQKSFYNNTSQYLIAKDTGAYSQQVFENSPLQRLLSAGNIGGGFQPLTGQHYKKMNYRYNATGDGNILIWNPDGTYTAGNYYAVNSLSVTDAIDEDNHETLIFTDLAGRSVLKRQVLGSTPLDTYYIYNNAGMISYAIPPNAVSMLAANSYNLTVAPLSNVVFHYVYDNRGRIIQKSAPAKGKIYIIYDPLNRPVLMQDTDMAANHQWNYMRYDAKGRVISQGIYIDATHTTRQTMQTYVSSLSYATAWFESRNNVAATGYYTANIFPTTVTGTITPLAYAYYDDYDLKQTGSANYTYLSQITGETGATAAQVKGMPTMTRTATVGSGITAGTWLLKVVMYDKRGNAIQVQSNNQLYYTAETVTDYKTTLPDFMGVPQVSKISQQTSSTASVTVQTTLTYDQIYRLLTVNQQYNGGTAIQTASYSYNEIGQLIKKGLGKSGSTNLQNVDYRYNIRGQVTSINNNELTNDGGVTNSDTNDVFGMAIFYDQSNTNIGSTGVYSGNISAVAWMSKDASGNSSYARSYKYTYDQANRYTASNYAERTTTSTAPFTLNVGGFDESGITYDAAGNILTLNRNSSTQGTTTHVQIDNLVYTYSSINPNELLSITDGTDANHTGAGFRNMTGSTATYAYDQEGNLTSDPYKGLTLAYDYLNKMDKITFTTATNRWIDYTYDGSGNILRKRQFDNNVQQNMTDYIDGFVYVNNTLSYFPMPEGRVINSAGTLSQEYVITDPQGNARVSFKDNGSGVAVVTQENSYYATGLIMPNSPVATSTVPNKKLFNGGSEWQNDFTNLPDYYQTFFRNYDAATARFISTDPDPESAESMTTYQYSYNNPILFNDPMGDVGGPSGNGHPGGHPYPREGMGNYGTSATIPDGPPADLIPVWDNGNSTDYLNWVDQQTPANIALQNALKAGGKTVYQAPNESNGYRSSGIPEGNLTPYFAYAASAKGGVGDFSQHVFSYTFNDPIATTGTGIGFIYDFANQGGMSLSPQGLDFVARHEGFGNNGVNPYNDGHGFATVGYGHLLHKSGYTAADVAKYGGMTRAQGQALLAVDVLGRVNELNSLLQVPVTQWQFDALFDMAFRNGMGAFGNSQLLQDINAGRGWNSGLIMDDFEQWTDHGHEVGRDQDEIELYFNNDYNYTKP